jgi:hypothetical protein
LEDRKALLLHEFSISKDTSPTEATKDAEEKADMPPQEVSQSVEYPFDVTPTIELMLQFDQVLTQRLLGYFTVWLSRAVRKDQSK